MIGRVDLALKARRYTLFSTPIITPVLRTAAWLLLKLMGWRSVGKLPEGTSRCVMIAAPHTSNWDGIIMCSVALCLRIRIFWMAKSNLFRFGFGPLLKWCGGIPVDRTRPGGLVGQAAEALKAAREMVIVVAPEGTRSAVEKWRTGFYRIAVIAGTPIVLGFLDYHQKEGGILGRFDPTGDLDRDMAELMGRYAHIKGRRAKT